MYLPSAKALPKWRRKSLKLVTSFGRVGPRSVSPRKAAVLVATPSIGRGPRSISSMKTPGARYSGMDASVRLRVGSRRLRLGQLLGLGDPRVALQLVPALLAGRRIVGCKLEA